MLSEKHQPSGDRHRIRTNPTRRGEYLQRHLLTELGMRTKILVFWNTTLPHPKSLLLCLHRIAGLYHNQVIREKLWGAWTLFTKDKNSIQKQTSSFRHEQAELEKKLVQLRNLCLQRVGAHPGGARACGLCCLTFPITFSTTVLLCSDQALFPQTSPSLFIKEKSQIHAGCMTLDSPPASLFEKYLWN